MRQFLSAKILIRNFVALNFLYLHPKQRHRAWARDVDSAKSSILQKFKWKQTQCLILHHLGFFLSLSHCAIKRYFYKAFVNGKLINDVCARVCVRACDFSESCDCLRWTNKRHTLPLFVCATASQSKSECFLVQSSSIQSNGTRETKKRKHADLYHFENGPRISNLDCEITRFCNPSRDLLTLHTHKQTIDNVYFRYLFSGFECYF